MKAHESSLQPWCRDEFTKTVKFWQGAHQTHKARKTNENHKLPIHFSKFYS